MKRRVGVSSTAQTDRRDADVRTYVEHATTLATTHNTPC